MKKILLALALSLGFQTAQAAMSPIVTVRGQLVGISAKTVELKTASGIVSVPRRAFKDQNALKPNSMQQIRLPLREFVYTTRVARR